MLVIYLMVANIAGFVIMGMDKYRARAGAWRVPEKHFLLISLLGGAAGVYLGVRLFRHKTRHLKFTVAVPLIMAAQAALLTWCVARGFRL